jgi:hypothetical protein
VSQKRLQRLRKTGKGNIVIKEKYGKEEKYFLKCKTCKHCFCETRGTAFFCLYAPKEEVLRVLAMLRLCFPKKEAFVVWLAQRIIAKARSLAGLGCRKHCRVNEYYLNELKLERVQVDEIWSYIKKKKRT